VVRREAGKSPLTHGEALQYAVAPGEAPGPRPEPEALRDAQEARKSER
jgi:hypothetical protein